jgi:glycosyltransferase involved in cell wall biosynthesis
MLKIGFDARWYFKGNPSGVVVVKNLVRQLMLNDQLDRIVLFLRRSDKNKKFEIPLSDKVRFVYIPSFTTMIANMVIIPLFFSRTDIDIFIGQYYIPLISRFKRIVVIHDVIFESNPEYFNWKERIYFYLIKLCARYSNKVVTVSNNEKNRLIKYNYAEDSKIEVIYNGVNEEFKPKEFHNFEQLNYVKKNYKLPDEFILYVGRLNKRKNIPMLINSLKYLSKNIKLVLVGDKNTIDFNFNNYTYPHEILRKVIFTGYVPGNHLPLIYALSTLFCYISFDEGFGLPPVEAMASGIPIIVTNTGSLPEICKDAGNYVNPLDPFMISTMINELLNNKILYKEKRNIGLEISKQYNWSISAAKLMQVCSQLNSKNEIIYD